MPELSDGVIDLGNVIWAIPFLTDFINGPRPYPPIITLVIWDHGSMEDQAAFEPVARGSAG
jgi:hypothetical protein